MISTYTVALSSKSHQLLEKMITESGETLQVVLDKAIENYYRQKFLEEANQAFAKLRNDPEAWQAEMEEREAWDITLNDGLE